MYENPKKPAQSEMIGRDEIEEVSNKELELDKLCLEYGRSCTESENSKKKVYGYNLPEISTADVLKAFQLIDGKEIKEFEYLIDLKFRILVILNSTKANQIKVAKGEETYELAAALFFDAQMPIDQPKAEIMLVVDNTDIELKPRIENGLYYFGPLEADLTYKFKIKY